MQTFTSVDLQRQNGDVQRAASREGVVVTSRGKPRNVMLSVEEFCRLNRMAHEPIPAALILRRPVVVRHVPDPLGYDVSDFRHVAAQMSEEAINGVNDDAVEVELDRVRSLFSGDRR